ncbi:MAG: hypothetical protein AAFW75_11600 [Cyanobacteria bacterium J06636_16]
MMSRLLWFLCATLAGIISVTVIGSITFAGLFGFIAKAEYHGTEPYLTGNYLNTFVEVLSPRGASLILVMGSVPYSFMGLIAGAIVGWQASRLSRRAFISIPYFQAILWLMVNAGLTYLGTGILSGVAFLAFLTFYPSGEFTLSSLAIAYKVTVAVLIIVAIACLSFNVILPRLLTE